MNMTENEILGFDTAQLAIFNDEENVADAENTLIHANDGKFFIDYEGKTMKRILEDRGYEDCWSFVNTDTHEIVEAPDVNWLFNVIFELKEVQLLDDKLIVSLLEEYFVERKKGIIDEWRLLAARYMDLYPEEYNKIKNINNK